MLLACVECVLRSSCEGLSVAKPGTLASLRLFEGYITAQPKLTLCDENGVYAQVPRPREDECYRFCIN